MQCYTLYIQNFATRHCCEAEDQKMLPSFYLTC